MSAKRIAMAFLMLAASAAAANAGTSPVVVELFTSQSCSDCPSADKLLAELAGKPDVIALSFPITYWDMLGWKDTLASEANTKRQRAYAKAMNRTGVYTPQIVVDGVVDVAGNKREAVKTAMAAHAGRRAYVPVGLLADGKHILITVGDGAPANATIWLLRTNTHTSVTVGGGENKGRSLTYANVVRELVAISSWSGQALTIDMDPRAGSQRGAGADALVVLVQENGNGPILGAAMTRIGAPGTRLRAR